MKCKTFFTALFYVPKAWVDVAVILSVLRPLLYDFFSYYKNGDKQNKKLTDMTTF